MQTINVIRRQTNRIRPALRFQFDYWMLLTVGALLILGLLMVYSTTYDYGFRFKDDSSFYIRRQMTAAAIGIVSMVVIMQFDYRVLRRVSVIFLLGTLGLLAFVLFAGSVSFGAVRGLSEGSYQPSELAKLATVMYIAHWLSSKGDRIKDVTYGLLPFSLITGTVCALIVRQPDLSTAILVALTSFTIFFIAGADWRQFMFAGLIGGAAFISLMLTLDHARGRVDAYTTALQDPSQAHWHVQQSLIALGTGGWFGEGLGRGAQKFGPLPFAHTDGVFAVIGEELGFMGTFAVIVLFVLFAWRGFVAAKNARDSYGSLLALGITCWFCYQALINVAVITAVIPFTGMPIPFLSYGGTSLAVTLMASGVLLNISRDASIGKTLAKETRTPQTPLQGQPAPPPPSQPRREPRPAIAVQMNKEVPDANFSMRRRNGRRDLSGARGRRRNGNDRRR